MLANDTLTPLQKVVLLTVGTFDRIGEGCTTGTARLVRQTRCNASVLRRTVRELVALGLLRSTPRPGQPLVLCILREACLALAPIPDTARRPQPTQVDEVLPLPVKGDEAGSAPAARAGPGPLARPAEDGARPAVAVPVPEPATKVSAATPWPVPAPADPLAGRLVEQRRFIVVRRALLVYGHTYQPGEEVPGKFVTRAMERVGYVVRAELSDAAEKAPVGEVPAGAGAPGDAVSHDPERAREHEAQKDVGGDG